MPGEPSPWQGDVGRMISVPPGGGDTAKVTLQNKGRLAQKLEVVTAAQQSQQGEQPLERPRRSGLMDMREDMGRTAVGLERWLEKSKNIPRCGKSEAEKKQQSVEA